MDLNIKIDSNKASNFNENIFEDNIFKNISKNKKRNNKTILINGIDFDKISNIELAYYLNKNIDFPINDNLNIEDNTAESNSMKEENNEEKSYCICKNNNYLIDSNSKMIMCDGDCKNWFHTYCIKMSKIEQKLIEYNSNIVWYCSNCVYNK